jgi:hypothetical protein
LNSISGKPFFGYEIMQETIKEDGEFLPAQGIGSVDVAE